MKSHAGFSMAENPYSPSKPAKTLAERLGSTGNKIAELSKQAASATKEAMSKVADAGKGELPKHHKRFPKRKNPEGKRKRKN